MGSGYLTNPILFLIQTLFGIYILIVVLRFLFQLTRADFYNPISQFVVKVTNPVLRPLRRIVPGLGGLDVSSLVLAWLLKSVELALVVALRTGNGFHPGVLLWALPELVALTINIFLFAILIQVIISWVNPGSYNPVIGLLHSLTGPVLGPARRLLPPISGLDLSPMLAGIGLILLEMLLLPPLRAVTGSPF